MVMPHELLCYLVATWIYFFQNCVTTHVQPSLLPCHLFPHIGLHAQENRKISWKSADVTSFWKHWRDHVPFHHPAAEEGKHIPIGIFGDDAKYTLAGAKVIVMLLNFVVQNTMRALTYLCVCFLVLQRNMQQNPQENVLTPHVHVTPLGLDLSRFPFFVLRYELTLGQQTMDPILRVIAWSFNASQPQLY